MRIVHIEDFFHPEAGYQINVLTKHQSLQGHEVIIITSEMKKVPSNLTSFFDKDNIQQKDKFFEKETGVKILRLPLFMFVSGRAVYKTMVKRKVDELTPDILYIHGEISLVAMTFLLKSNRLTYPIILDSHMLEIASKNKFSKLFQKVFRLVFTPIIKRKDIKVIRTQDDRYIEKCLGIPLSQAPLISHGTDTDIFQPDNIIRKKFRKQHNISEDEFVVVYTGKLDESKGGKLLASAFKERFGNEKIVLLVVGNTTGDYGKEVEHIFESSDNKVIRFPTQKYTELAKFYQASDLSVFPKQCSLSFYDAQACGVPVVSENNSVNYSRLKYSNGFTFINNNMEDFRRQIYICANMDSSEYQQMRRNSEMFIKENYDYRQIVNEYSEILMNEYKRYHKYS